MSQPCSDRISGMIVGHALGDALGTPSEFPPHANYEGVLVANVRVGRFTGKTTWAVGQVSDDTEMTLALVSSLSERGEYDVDRAATAYMEWANSGAVGMGKNTRLLFKGVKTIRGYKARAAKAFETEVSQSNGCLMRAYPFALVKDGEAACERDVNLTNPTDICREAVRVYCKSVREALRGSSRGKILEVAAQSVAHPDLVRAIADANVRAEAQRDIARSRGWVAHAFYCAYWALAHFGDYKSAIDAVVVHSRRIESGKTMLGDTDTNAAIAGALLGAFYGLERMRSAEQTKENLHVLLSAKTADGGCPRPAKYEFSCAHKHAIASLAHLAANL